jgi:hypothetical protein
MIRRENDDGQPPSREILLIPEILVAGEQQSTVVQSLPSQLFRAGHLMSAQTPSEWGRGIGIE